MSRTREAGKKPLKWCKVHLLGASLSTYKFISSRLYNRMFALFSKYGGSSIVFCEKGPLNRERK